MPETLGRELQVICDDYMSELLDLYNCQDWGMGFVEFLEKATEVTSETIGRWQSESMDEEE
jgi:hypothetical protein